MIELKNFRLSKHLSQEKMARMLDITVSYYSQIERGDVPFSREFIFKIKTNFPDVDVNNMFFNENIINDYLYKKGEYNA